MVSLVEFKSSASFSYNYRNITMEVFLYQGSLHFTININIQIKYVLTYLIPSI